MDSLIDILLPVLGLLAVGLTVYWSVVAFHVARSFRTAPTLRDAMLLPESSALNASDAPRVCIVVPAHNEEACIGLLLASLLQQDYPRDRIRMVFALDRCTDRTRSLIDQAVRGDARVEIVEIANCPPDWVGKVHALWEGTQRATEPRNAELLLFVDADTILDAGCVRAAVTLLRSRGLDMLSVLSTLTSERWFELVVQPVAAIELIRQYPIKRANDPKGRRPFANGQFILVRREAYETIGGHEALRWDVLEDVWLARRLAGGGFASGLFLADGMLRCRMYSNWAAFRRGWLRIFGECASRKPGRLRRTAWRQRFTGTVLPLSGPAAVIDGAWAWMTAADLGGIFVAALGLVGTLIWVGTIGAVYRKGSVPLWAVPLAPFGSWLVGSLQLEAARNLERGEATVWGGRTYQRNAR